MTLIKVAQSHSTKFKITSSHVLTTSLVISGIAFSWHYVCGYPMNMLIGLLAIQPGLTAAVTLIWGWNEYFPKKHEPSGFITLSPKEIALDNQKYALDELNNLTFDINDFKGERVYTPIGFPAGPCLSHGVNNHIKFNSKGLAYSIQFQLGSEQELQELRRYVTQLFVNKISFSETFKRAKSYGLEHPNYKEIQEYKRKQKP